jgi:hypothetical protein
MGFPTEGVAPDDEAGGLNSAEIYGRKGFVHIIIFLFSKMQKK